MDFTPFPSFSRENLSIWFAQMESAFYLNDTIEESDKYHYLLLHVPSDSLKLVEDIILSPPRDDKYEHIKYQMIKRMVIKRMMETKFGNEIPSEYLRKLKYLAGQRVSNEEILNVWRNNLPEKVRELVCLGTGMDRLCEMADKAIVLLSPQNITSTQPMLSFSKTVCWYHTNFGDKAIACVAPCDYKVLSNFFNFNIFIDKSKCYINVVVVVLCINVIFLWLCWLRY